MAAASRRWRRALGVPLRSPAYALSDVAAMIRSGRALGEAYVQRCLDAHLLQRYAAARGHDEQQMRRRPAQAAAYAELAGRADLLRQTLDDAAAAWAAGRLHRAEYLQVLQRSWHVHPERAGEALRQIAPQHPALALLPVGTAVAGLAARTAEPAGRDADGWLVQARLAASAADKLVALNFALARLGQGPVALEPAAAGLRVGTLADGGSAPVRPRPATTLRVSVIMTCHDNAEHLDASIRSVLQQHWRELELWVVDDASRDGSVEVVRRHAARDARVRLIPLADNVGTYAAKNVALAQAAGDLVAFNDADDWSHPERLQRIVERFASDARLMAVRGQFIRLTDAGEIRSPKLYPLLRWSPNSLVFRRKQVMSAVGYFDENRFGSDSEYLGRVRAAFPGPGYRELRELHFIACERATSLMHGTAYGLDPLGYSAPRRAYEEWWSEQLLQRLVDGRSLYRPPGTTEWSAPATGA